MDYLPAESNTGLFGGNSNWRGPVWMPVNALIIRALLSFYLYYGDNFKIECPTGSGRLMNLFEVAKEIADRLTEIFLRDEHGRRPVYGGAEKFQTDPALARPYAVLRILPWRQRRRPRREPSDRMDRTRRQNHRTLWLGRSPDSSRKSAGRPHSPQQPGSHASAELAPGYLLIDRFWCRCGDVCLLHETCHKLGDFIGGGIEGEVAGVKDVHLGLGTSRR